jgi:V/A-type H+-transporting ATPase subunit D
MAVAISEIHPTRGELLKTLRQITLTKRGYELLKEKRDALVMEFFNVLTQLEDARKRTYEVLGEAYRSLSHAMVAMGSLEVRKAAAATGIELEIDIATRNIMGVAVPVIEAQKLERKVTERGYSLVQTSAELDLAAKKFEKALVAMLKLAEIEETLRLLARETERTKRRVNSLEHVVIPRLETIKKFIERHLEELERENFFRLKRIKAMIA